MEVPSTPWRAEPWPRQEALRHAPLVQRAPSPDWLPVDGAVEHVFTHFALRLSAVRAIVADTAATAEEGRWIAPDGLAALALPTLMRKLVRLVTDAARR